MYHQKYSEIIGVDVASRKLDVYCNHSGKHQVVVNSMDSIENFVNNLGPDCLIVMEATGGYERQLLEVLHQYRIDCTVINPLRVRQFAKGCGKLEKTDKIDSKMLAEFGAVVKPKLHRQPSPEHRKLQRLVHRRDCILSHLQAEKNRLSRECDDQVKQIIQEAIDFYQQQAKQIDRTIAKTIDQSEQLAKESKLLRTCPGVGPVTTAVLIAEFPELGQLNRGQVAKLAGIAPIANDSGQKIGKRKTHAGRSRIRKAIYMAALVASQKNQRLKKYYLAMLTRGKPKKVALIAIARKMLVALNSMIKKQESWRETSLAIDKN